MNSLVPRRVGRVTRIYLEGDDPRMRVDLDSGHTLIAFECRRLDG